MRVTEITPTHCSSCFAQKPDETHVDFEASWDGPVFNTAEKGSEPTFVAIDELIVCESCLRQAGALVQLKPAARIEAEKAQLEDRNRELAERLNGALDHIARLEEAQASAGRLVERLGVAGKTSSPTTSGGSGQRRRRGGGAAGAQVKEAA